MALKTTVISISHTHTHKKKTFLKPKFSVKYVRSKNQHTHSDNLPNVLSNFSNITNSFSFLGYYKLEQFCNTDNFGK